MPHFNRNALATEVFLSFFSFWIAKNKAPATKALQLKYEIYALETSASRFWLVACGSWLVACGL
jgi:hypothetical protein